MVCHHAYESVEAARTLTRSLAIDSPYPGNCGSPTKVLNRVTQDPSFDSIIYSNRYSRYNYSMLQ